MSRTMSQAVEKGTAALSTAEQFAETRGWARIGLVQ